MVVLGSDFWWSTHDGRPMWGEFPRVLAPARDFGARVSLGSLDATLGIKRVHFKVSTHRNGGNSPCQCWCHRSNHRSEIHCRRHCPEFQQGRMGVQCSVENFWSFVSTKLWWICAIGHGADGNLPRFFRVLGFHYHQGNLHRLVSQLVSEIDHLGAIQNIR